MDNAADDEVAYDDIKDPLAIKTEEYVILEYDADELLEVKLEIEDLAVDLIDAPAEAMPEPLFPITKRMQERIKQMKRRMLVTLRLSDAELAKRREKRAAETRRRVRQKGNGDVDANRQDTLAKRIAWLRIQRQMETPEQTEIRRAKNRITKAKHRQMQTPEQKKLLMEKVKMYKKERQPVKFI